MRPFPKSIASNKSAAQPHHDSPFHLVLQMLGIDDRAAFPGFHYPFHTHLLPDPMETSTQHAT